MGTVALRAMGVADGVGLGSVVGAGLGAGVDDGVAETEGSGLGVLDGLAADTIAAAGGTTPGPGVDQPPSGKDDRPLQAATHRISAGSSRRSGRIAGRDRMRVSFGIATVDASRQEAV
jgi:hypothetical protein